MVEEGDDEVDSKVQTRYQLDQKLGKGACASFVAAKP